MRKLHQTKATLIGLATAVFASQSLCGAESTLVSDYRKEVFPIVKELCVRCHGPEKQKGDLRLDQLDPNVVNGHDAEIWGDVLDQVNLGEMPPPKETQPTGDQRRALVDWMARALREGAEAKRFADGRVTTRRLTRYEYANTMREMLGINFDFARELPPEPTSPEGFLNNGSTLEISPNQIETYLKIARQGLDLAIVTGEQPTVHEYSQQETAVGKLPNRKTAGHLPVNPEFLLDVKEFPRRGEFEIKITAKAAIPNGHGMPKMRVSMGHIPGIVHVPRITVGEVDVPDKPTTFTFRGRMEDYPQPGDQPFGNVAFKGMIVIVDFFDADGNELRYPDRQYVIAPPKPKKGQPEEKKAPKPFDSRPDIMVESAGFKAPVFASWPPPSHQELLPDGEDGLEETIHVRNLLGKFMTRAFRRPVSDEELQQTVDLFTTIRANTDSFAEAMRETYASVLVSPHFLYIVEKREKGGQPQQLNNYELASRLSYFLWSSMPDQRLFELAKNNGLSKPANLRAEVSRMLEDDRAAEFTSRFADQWFDLGALDRVAVNPEFFPDFDNALKEEMRKETQAYLAAVISEDRSALELIESDWAIVNRQLANHYGLEGPQSSAFEKVSLKGRRTGGLLGQGAFLLANANGEDSHPIKRAVWVLDRLLDSPPAPPPPDVPELDPSIPDLAKLTLKEQLAAHREKESCANCHAGIDPWGVPFEHFDAVGNWRGEIPQVKARKNSPAKPIDAASTLPDGTEIDGMEALTAYIIKERSRWFARSVVKRLMAYSLGRSLDIGDRGTVEELTGRFIESDFRIKPLIMNLVTSEAFLTK